MDRYAPVLALDRETERETFIQTEREEKRDRGGCRLSAADGTVLLVVLVLVLALLWWCWCWCWCCVLVPVRVLWVGVPRAIVARAEHGLVTPLVPHCHWQGPALATPRRWQTWPSRCSRGWVVMVGLLVLQLLQLPSLLLLVVPCLPCLPCCLPCLPACLPAWGMLVGVVALITTINVM
jgi:hypothetical protein